MRIYPVYLVEGLVIVFLVLLKWEVAAILGIKMGVEFKDKVMLHGFRVVKCRWEVSDHEGKVGRWERWKCNDEVARLERLESGVIEVGWWKVSGFIQG